MIAWLIALAIVLLYVLASALVNTVPFEDAAMLMRYARHLAQGHGMVWNIGAAPVDGATDFLFTVLVAGTMQAGFTVEAATQALILWSHLAGAALLLVLGWRERTVPLAVAAGIVAYVLLGPGSRFVQSYFGSPVFALAALTLLVTLRWAEHTPGHRRAIAALVAAALSLGLMRPEGNLLAGFMFIAFVASTDDARFRRTLWTALATYAAAGAAFLAWRTAYFGQMMPNPFYLKGGWHLYEDSLRASVQNTLEFVLPLTPVFGAVLIVRVWTGIKLKAVRELLPALLFVLIWVLLNNDNNHWGRFQYPVLPLLLAGLLRWLGILYPGLVASGGSVRKLVVACAVYLALIPPAYAIYKYGAQEFVPDGRYAVAKALQPIAPDGLTMAVTEAGLLPLYSEWKAIDVWGLNDQWIARSGTVTAAYLDKHAPALIMLHENTWPNGNPRWRSMVDTLLSYARSRNYTLAARYERGYSIHYYFVRRGIPREADIVGACRPSPYIWWLDAQPISSSH